MLFQRRLRELIASAICLTLWSLFFSVPALPESLLEVQSKNFGRIPLTFESNQGQANAETKFLSRGRGYSISFEEHEAVLALSKHKSPNKVPHESGSRGLSEPKPSSHLIRLHLVGADETPQLSGEEKLSGTVNYFRGKSPSQWHTAIPTFAKVKYSGVYPGIDLLYYGNQEHLEFDFKVAAGADTKLIQLRFPGANKLQLDSEGNLTIFATNGKVTFRKPAIYQTGPKGEKQFIKGEFLFLSSNTIGFRLGTYDKARSLVIDPILSYSTYLGRFGEGDAIAVDSSGNAYITGLAGLDFPTTAGVTGEISAPKPGSYNSVFVTKLNSSGTAVVYSTYLSGTGGDQGTAITVDAQGNAYSCIPSTMRSHEGYRCSQATGDERRGAYA